MSAMGDFYLRVIEQTGLDPEDEASLEVVDGAWKRAPRGLAAIDLFDTIVDDIILNQDQEAVWNDPERHHPDCLCEGCLRLRRER